MSVKCVLIICRLIKSPYRALRCCTRCRRNRRVKVDARDRSTHLAAPQVDPQPVEADANGGCTAMLYMGRRSNRKHEVYYTARLPLTWTVSSTITTRVSPIGRSLLLSLSVRRCGEKEKRWREKIQAGGQKERDGDSVCDAVRDRSLVANVRILSEPRVRTERRLDDTGAVQRGVKESPSIRRWWYGNSPLREGCIVGIGCLTGEETRINGGRGEVAVRHTTPITTAAAAATATAAIVAVARIRGCKREPMMRAR